VELVAGQDDSTQLELIATRSFDTWRHAGGALISIDFRI
jgi:hypothetical protein